MFLNKKIFFFWDKFRIKNLIYFYPIIKKKRKDKGVNKFLKNLLKSEGLGVSGGFKLKPAEAPCTAERWR